MAAYTTIDDPEAYFQVQLYTGDGAANHAITLGGTTDMQPDLVWIKNRDATDYHVVTDAVRGATKVLPANETDAETTDTDTVDSFTSDGFQVDADVKVNTDGEDYVAWCWKANGSGSSNTTGSINTTATSANTTAGFSISTYAGNATSGATIGHGLGAVPDFIMGRKRNDGQSWVNFHTSLGETKFISLNQTIAAGTASDRWNDTAPSSTVVTLGSGGDTNGSFNYVMYAWTDIQGFSKFGSYIGNGNANGTFVYTGFRPAFFMVKKTSGTNDWYIVDNKRLGYNVDNDLVFPNLATTDNTGDYVDILSNGLKNKGTDGGWNASGATYVYMAWAEAPFVNSEGVPCNAR